MGRMKKVLKKLKDTWYMTDRLTLFLAVIVVVGTVTLLNVEAAGGSSTNNSGVDITMENMAIIMHDAGERIFTNINGSGNAKVDQVNIFNQYVDISTIGNYLGPSNQEGSSGANTATYHSTGNSGPTYNISVEQHMSLHIPTADSENMTVYDRIRALLAQDSVMATAEDPVIQYIIMGQMWNDLGIDETTTADSNGNAFRKIFGYATYGSYVLAYTASGLIKTVIDVMGHLDILNYIFTDDIGNGVLDGVASGSSTATYINSILNAQLMQDIRSIYQQLGIFRYVILGLMIVIFIASITVFKSKSYNAKQVGWTRGRNLAYRIVVMFIGLPLVIMVYHECIKILGAYTETIRYRISAYVYEEFCDFRGWTANNETAFKLGYPILAEYDLDTHQVKVYRNQTDELNIAQLIYSINVNSSGGVDGMQVDFTGDDYVANDFANNDVTYEQIVRYNTTLVSEDTVELYRYCRNLLLDYARGVTINPNDYDSVMKNDHALLTKRVQDIMFGQSFFNTMSEDDQAKLNAAVSAVELMILSEGTQSNDIWSYVEGMYGSNPDRATLQPASTDLWIQLSGAPGGGHGDAISSGSLTTSGINISSDENGSGSSLFRKVLGVSSDGSGSVQLVKANVGTMYTHSNSDTAIPIIFDLSTGGMSALSMYNYMNTVFEDGSATVYNRSKLTNDAVAMHHYAVTAAYTGLNEIIQLFYTFVMLLSFGMVGWIFGVSMMMNIIIETIKMIPSIFKMMIGSVQGFVESMATVMAIITEMLVTGLLYNMSINIIDFIVRAVRAMVAVVIDILTTNGESVSGAGYDVSAAISNFIVILAILWGAFQLIRWRKAIIITIKSMITTVLNAMFGTKAAMPTGATGGMMSAVAGVGAAAVAAHSLAGDGGLSEVVNDLAGEGTTDKLSDAWGQLKDGDLSGAMDTLGLNGSENGANGGSGDDGTGGDVDPRSGMGETDYSGTDDGSGLEGVNTDFNEDGYRDDQQRQIDEAIARNDYDEAKDLEDKFDTENHGSKEAAEEFRKEHKSEEKKFPERADQNPDKTGSTGWDRAAEIYDANGLTAEQEQEIDDMVDGVSTNPETGKPYTDTEIAARMDQMAQENFGSENYREAIAAINDHAGRTGGTVTYGSGSGGKTVSVSSGVNASTGAYTYSVATDGDTSSATTVTSTYDEDQGRTVYAGTVPALGGGTSGYVSSGSPNIGYTPGMAMPNMAGGINGSDFMMRRLPKPAMPLPGQPPMQPPKAATQTVVIGGSYEKPQPDAHPAAGNVNIDWSKLGGAYQLYNETVEYLNSDPEVDPNNNGQ